MLTLRPYQQAAVDAAYLHLKTADDNPCIVIPTGGGKTPVIATICRDAVQWWNGRVLVLAHVKELLEQTVDKLRRVCPDIGIGIYSAGLGRKDLGYSVTVAGIQSIYKRACDLDRTDLIIIDECFVAGTLISTPTGVQSIEQIQPGMIVRNATGIGRVVAVSAKSAKDVVTLEFSDGTTITCTPNHPIFTHHGWTPAGSLEIGAVAFGEESVHLLQEHVSSMASSREGWHPCDSKRETLEQAKVLLKILFQDNQQSDAVTKDVQNDQQDNERSGACSADEGRQWGSHKPTDATTRASGHGVDSGSVGTGSGTQITSVAEEFENRHSQPGINDRNRIGRIEPSFADSSCPRFPQDNLPGTKRLVRVSHHKPEGGRVVFNLQVSGHPSYFANEILAHNCHMIPIEGDGMYRQFLADAKIVNPEVRVIGLTATPFRMKSGTICTPESFLNRVCYKIGVKDLINDGFLSIIRSKAGTEKAKTSDLHVRGGEFVPAEAEAMMSEHRIVDGACREIVQYMADRKSCLIFAAGCAHGRLVAATLKKLGVDCGFVDAETPGLERMALLSRFQRGELKYLANVNILTTGFDAPNIDCVALLRPTMSPGLYYQMVGRGFRMNPGKTDCLVLDFAGNVERHGPVDQLDAWDPDEKKKGVAPVKECPKCHALLAISVLTCPECGHEFPVEEKPKHEPVASTAGIISGQETIEHYNVSVAYYRAHTKYNAPEGTPRTLRIDYAISFYEMKSEWVCVEHDGFAGQKAAMWWAKRCKLPMPRSAERAAELANAGALAGTSSISVKKIAGEKFDRIIDYTLTEIPEPSTALVAALVEEAATVEPDGGYAGEPPAYVIKDDDIPF